MTPPFFEFVYILVITLGAIAMMYQLQTLLFIIMPSGLWAKFPGREIFLVPGIAKAERSTKQAAEFKAQKLIYNALCHHEGTLTDSSGKILHDTGTIRSSGAGGAFGKALLHFQATSDLKEWTGGILWSFRNMWNGKIFKEEGVWLHARLIAGNLSQVFVAVFFVLIYGYALTLIEGFYNDLEGSFAPTVSPAPSFSPETLLEITVNDTLSFAYPALYAIVFNDAEFLDLFWSKVDPSLVLGLTGGIFSSFNGTQGDLFIQLAQNAPPEALEAFYGVVWNHISENGLDPNNPFGTGPLIDPGIRRLQEEEGGGGLEDLLPKQWEAVFALSVGGFAAFATTMALASVWLPSSISTIMQFRSGVIPSLRDSKFETYRVSRKYKQKTGRDSQTSMRGSPNLGWISLQRIRQQSSLGRLSGVRFTPLVSSSYWSLPFVSFWSIM